MKFIRIGLYVLQFLYSALPELIEFIQKAVQLAKEFIDGLKNEGASEDEIAGLKAMKREAIISEAKAKFDVPESIIRIALETEVYKHKAVEKEGESEVEMAKNTYPQLFGQG